jgi:tRNA-2-methylthio-N6-dimethylallyladenosine synthase
MNREYSREWYLDRVNAIKTIIPECALSTDMITGFCTETDEDHRESLSLMELVEFDFAYMFKYSERPGTKAARKYSDDVPEIASKRSEEFLSGRTSQNKVVVFPGENHRKGEYVNVIIERSTSATLIGRLA